MVNITVETRAFIPPVVTLLLPVVGSTGDTLFILKLDPRDCGMMHDDPLCRLA